MALTRRRFLQLVGLGTVAVAGVGHAAPRRVRLTAHEVPWPGARGLRLVHLTDLHLGWATPRELLHQVVSLAERAAPDLVVLTGDYLNHSLKHLRALERLVALLPRPCLATLGNHDHWSGAEAVESALEQAGVVVLRNRPHRVALGGRRLTVVGVDDSFTGHDDIEAAFAQVGSAEPVLALTHCPKIGPALARRGARLILTGHTHAGQVQVPLVTRAVSRLAGQRYLAGWYELGPSRLYVNAGVGSSAIRWRLGARAAPELAIVTLV